MREFQPAADHKFNIDSAEIFSRIVNTIAKSAHHSNTLKASLLDTPIGTMIAIADEKTLYLLEFMDCRKLEREIECLRVKTQSRIVAGRTAPLDLIEKELNQYFANKLAEFKTPLAFIGTSFQNNVWAELNKIPYGETRSYADVAKAISNPRGFRAVARTNGANQLAIIIPCHRVINSNGALGGYSAGLIRKEWLLRHEQRITN